MKKHKLTTLSDRLVDAIEITGTKKADLARAINVQPQTIQHLCNGKVQSSRFTFEIATVLGLNTKWLATGEGEPFLSDDSKPDIFKAYKIFTVLNSESLIVFAKTGELKSENAGEQILFKTNESDAFCVLVNDASMLPFFPKGSKILFKKINNMQLCFGIVIVYLPSFDAVLIRELQEKDGSIFLSPKNKTLFKEIELPKDAVIFGLAIECQFSV